MKLSGSKFFLVLATLCILMLALRIAAAAGVSEARPPQLTFSATNGFFDAPFSLKIASLSNGVVIRYTRDGQEPTLTNGFLYSTPLLITNTTLLRAAAFRSDTRVSAVVTRSYLHLDQILHQPKEPPGIPAGREAWNGMPSACQMDPRVVNAPAYRDRMREALKALPLVSIVCPMPALFGPEGLYLNSMQRGVGWEKACSAEFIPDGAEGFQLNCGIRIQGGMNRIPNRSPKHSFRLVFKEAYGPGKLHFRLFPDSAVDKFDTLVLRADYNNSWVHWDATARPRAQRTRDAWMKDSHRAMGWVSAHNRFVHLFLNGLYWGVYDFTERPDASFAAAYLGGTREDYDVINESVAKNGTLDQFNVLNSLTGLQGREPYEKLLEVLDMTEYIDYLLLNYYAGNQDWGETKNWYAIRRRTPPGRFQYFVWDGEQLLHDVSDNTVTQPYETPFRMAEELKGNEAFRTAFAERVRKHFFGTGALTPAACAARWMNRAREVDRAVLAESARWGYYRRGTPYTRDKEWIAEQTRLMKEYFPQRTGIVLEQLREVGLFAK